MLCGVILKRKKDLNKRYEEEEENNNVFLFIYLYIFLGICGGSGQGIYKEW